MTYPQVIGILALVMFGGCAYKFGEGWSPVVWGIALVVFLVYVLTLVNKEVATKLLSVLPAIVSRGKSFLTFNKKVVETSKPDDNISKPNGS